MAPTKARFDRCGRCYQAHVRNVPALQGSQLTQVLTNACFWRNLRRMPHMPSESLGPTRCWDFVSSQYAPKPNTWVDALSLYQKRSTKCVLPEPNLKHFKREQFGLSSLRVLLLEKSWQLTTCTQVRSIGWSHGGSKTHVWNTCAYTAQVTPQRQPLLTQCANKRQILVTMAQRSKLAFSKRPAWGRAP